MNTLLLQPTDILFFRDGRPMGGSLAGHAAAWPLPTVLNAALHAALHRADLEKNLGEPVHGHDHRSNGVAAPDARKFGSLLSAGPFPVTDDGQWLFPRPLDADDGFQPVFLPLPGGLPPSSLPKPLACPTAATLPPSKLTPAPWWNTAAFARYLDPDTTSTNRESAPANFKDDHFADTEFSFGIGMDPERGTQDGERFYSSHYLRLKPGHRLGLLAEAWDKINGDPAHKRDLIAALFPNHGAHTSVIVGGQQRLCTVEAHHQSTIPLPLGMTTGFHQTHFGGRDAWLVKYLLLSPAVFPGIEAGVSRRGTERKAHPGGWLPTWVCPETGSVLLQSITSEERRRRRQLNYGGQGYTSQPDIPATLVAALTGKPIPVTGYALAHEAAERPHGTAKPTQLAVPPGSVYYFTCPSQPAAEQLAAALNWHGADTAQPAHIRNRRSTLFGEKGFGLGLCGTWSPHDGNLPQ